jgi:quercetin dioxygenase-like cupin family protein
MYKLRAFLGVAALLACVTAARATALQDSTVADPDSHQVVLENEHTRVLQVMAPVGKKSPMHSHPPFLLVSLDTARVRVTYSDGKTQILDLRPGMIVWIDGIEHSWEVLAGKVDIVAVEVKSAKAAQATKQR